MRKTPYVLAVMLFTAALIAGCNLPLKPQNDPAIAQTAAALTVQAQIATVVPATFTAVPFPTIPPANTQAPVHTVTPAATATSSCDNADFVSDVTIPDETVIAPDDSFTKTWRIRNAGTCSWTSSYAVVFVNGNDMDGPTVQSLSGNVNPGQTVDLSVDLTAPAKEGDYTGNWGLRNASGVTFGHFWVKISVEAFKVTDVTYDRGTYNDGTTAVKCPVVTAHITTNGSGDVTYHWRRSDGTAVAPETIHFDSAGTKNVQYKWVLPSTTTEQSWLGITVDEPNDEDFGRKNVSPCTTP